MPPGLRFRLCLLIALFASGAPAFAQSILLDHRTATYGNPLKTGGAQSPTATTLNTRTLVTFNALPAEGDFEVLGQIDVHSRWFGTTSKAMKLLAEKSKFIGGNAVVESRVWLAPAFPAMIAPHGSGIAVRINDQKLLESLADSASTWE
ncbi:MAG: hypothetical protein H6R13_743 [Proteobacteria bacterium]|nr:hypothetical protein [Pseudomonadota bacterium]